VDDQQLI
jgi:hypothetical protein